MSSQFQPYLESICAAYEKWWQLYTLTDAIGKQEQSKETSPFFDFGLTVQTVAKDDREQQKKETVERFPVLEGIRMYADEHVLLVGRPGSGKSTALARLMLEEATTPQARIPVLVELRYWQSSIKELILNSLTRHGLSTEQYEAVLSRSLILFDGVNELPSEEARSQLSTFRRNNFKLPMIFTTRDLSIGGDLGIEKKLEMQPLKPEQMETLIRSYLSPEQAEEMLRQLKDRLQELGQTPLLLWMLCEVVQQSPDSKLPTNLGNVFQVFTQAYEKSSVRKHEVAALKGDVRPLSDRRLWKTALKALALVMMEGKTPVDFRVVIHRDEAERELSRIFPNEQFPIRDILDDLLNYHLLQNRTVDQIEFRHQLIQEYYVAEALLDRVQQLENEPLKQEFLNYLKWTEPVALMLALVEDEAQAVRVVTLALDVDWILGARLAGEVKQKLQKQTVKLVNDLIEERNLPEWLRVKLWQKTRLDEALPRLLESLNSPNIEIVRTVAAFVGQTNNQSVVSLLRDRLKEIDSRFFAQESFGGNDQTGGVWEKHVEALAYVDPQAAIELLRNRLMNQRTRFVLTFFTQAPALLMKLDAEEFLPELLDKLKDPDSEYDKNHLLNLIGSTPKAAYEAIVPELAQILEQQQDSSIQVKLIDLIGKSTSELATQVLIKLLAHANPELRHGAKKQLVQRNIKDFKQLEKLLTHQNLDIVRSAAFVLGSLGNASALPMLLSAMQYTSSSIFSAQAAFLEEYEQTAIRRMGAEALGSINNEEAVSCLLNALRNDPSPDVRRKAAFSLSNFGNQEAIPELLSALNKGSLDARVKGIKSLAKLKIEEPLWNMLKARETCWQTAAVELGKLSRAEVLPYLRQALADLGYESPDEILRLLSKFADLDTCRWLVEALDNPEPHKADQYFSNRIALVLVKCQPEVVANQLSALKNIAFKHYISQVFWVISTIQENCKYYNYEIFQDYLKAQKNDRSTHQDSDRSPTTINNFPNAKEIKIFENVDRYHEAPPKDPPP
ncbi:HEAT repeat domain-containing protein [Phormidesmis sp. 146-33]